MMPPGGAPTRAESLATVQRLAHELFTRDEIGELLDARAHSSRSSTPVRRRLPDRSHET